jgi:hypothetical protein
MSIHQLLLTITPLLAAAALLRSAPVLAAEDCPSDLEQRVHLIERAPTCESSLAVFERCSYGASGDLPLGRAVTRKCEGDFLVKLSRADRQSYDQQQKRCAVKYQGQSGSVYRSLEASCSATLAKDYARRFAKGTKP